MSDYKEQLIELFESASGCTIDEFTEDQLPYLADYIIGQQEADNMCIEKLKKENQRLATDRQNAIRLMSKSWQHDSENQDDLMTRYVTMAENQFKKKGEEIERLTAMATRHATRCDELYEALDNLLELVNSCEGLAGIDGNQYIVSPGDLSAVLDGQDVLDASRTEADK